MQKKSGKAPCLFLRVLRSRQAVDGKTISSEELRRQMEELERSYEEAKDHSAGLFRKSSMFSFKGFWSGTVIRLVYFLGFLGLNGALGYFAIRVIWFEGLHFLWFLHSLLPTRFAVFSQLLFLLLAGLALNLVWRVICEMCLVFFRLCDLLEEMNERLRAVQRRIS